MLRPSYIVLEAHSLDSLAYKINDRIKAGYTPIGALTILRHKGETLSWLFAREMLLDPDFKTNGAES